MYLQQSQTSGEEQLKGQKTFINEKQKKFIKGIPTNLVQSSKVQIQHLICSICKHVLWKPVTCNQPNCYANYCQGCLISQVKIDSNQKSIESRLKNLHNSQINVVSKACKKCQKQIQKTHFPLINNLLSNITFKCLFKQSGCQQIINYQSYLKHLIECDYKKIQCSGCKQSFFNKSIYQHTKNCQFIITSCSKCNFKSPQIQFKKKHTQIRCLEEQLHIKDRRLEKVEDFVDKLQNKLNQYQNLIEKIVKGQAIKLKIDFHTSFPSNFSINKNQVKLLKSSWNSLKQRYDFLHFYLTSVIKTDGPIGYEWKIVIKDLKGNLLIGICSSLGPNSVDYVINKFGQIKKKSVNQNKYRLTRKSDFRFNQKDIIIFKYISMRRTLKIINQTQNIECLFEDKQIQDLGQSIYTFYSLDTWGDSLKFI